ncbi:heme-binding protein [Nocardia sp. NPDC006044]|uniref:GlcG/HbpS family heme-binding protein n=1 Tax=Nocardia sp. NPDC006044 TaxID=3364306 RepID=UPI0036AAA180
MSLTLNEARDISLRVREHAELLGVSITVAIVDAGGHVRVLERMDGASPLSARVAPAKASSCVLFHRDGPDLAKMQQAWPTVFAQIDQIAGAPIIAGAGSRLIRRDGVIVGALSISGSTPAQDDEIADAALGLTPAPASG